MLQDHRALTYQCVLDVIIVSRGFYDYNPKVNLVPSVVICQWIRTISGTKTIRLMILYIYIYKKKKMFCSSLSRTVFISEHEIIRLSCHVLSVQSCPFLARKFKSRRRFLSGDIIID